MPRRLLVAIAFFRSRMTSMDLAAVLGGNSNTPAALPLVSPARYQLGICFNAENWVAGLRCPVMRNGKSGCADKPAGASCASS